MDTLFTPWRFPLVSAKEPATGCFFCEAARQPDDPERLVVAVERRHLVILNKYPYTNGHLMVAPIEHLSDPGDAGPEVAAEMWRLILRARRVLEQVYSPDGFNLGMNLGRAAGAGVPDHYHFHLVPRWSGDTNFASVVGGVRLIPDDLISTRRKLMEVFGGRSPD